jgi:twitching motility protein PilT
MPVSIIQIDELLRTTVGQDASDLILSAGSPPQIRVHGTLRDLPTRTLTGDDTEGMMRQITPDRMREQLDELGMACFRFAYGDDPIASFFVGLSKPNDTVWLILHRDHFPKPTAANGVITGG